MLARVGAGEAPGDAWAHLPARRFFQELAGEVIATYYAHPTAWAEIGFSGPIRPQSSAVHQYSHGMFLIHSSRGLFFVIRRSRLRTTVNLHQAAFAAPSVHHSEDRIT